MQKKGVLNILQCLSMPSPWRIWKKSLLIATSSSVQETYFLYVLVGLSGTKNIAQKSAASSSPMEKPGVEWKDVKRHSNSYGTTIFQRLQATQSAGKSGRQRKRYT